MNEEVVEIDSIVFGIFSPEEIIRNSVCKVTSSKLGGPNSVYDPRMGPIEMDKKVKCPSCECSPKECPGHLGHIELNKYIIHPLYYKAVISFLKCFCFDCYSLLFLKEQIELSDIGKFTREKRFKRILERVSKIDVCCKCSNPHPKVMYSTVDNTITIQHKIKKKVNKIPISTDEIKRIFDNVVDEDVRALGFDPSLTHPKNLIISVLPVVPPCARPFVMTRGTPSDDDLTIQLVEIIKANNHLENDNLPESKEQKYIQTLMFRIKTLMDNSQQRAKHTNNRPYKGIKERLTGKEGLIRNNLMGKRVEQSARTVIGPDPTLRIGELAVPYELCEILTIPEKVTRFNIDELSDIVNSGKANFLVRNHGKTRINLKYALFRRGTELLYGDIVVRPNESKIMIRDQKYDLQPGDRVFRDGELLKISLPQKKLINLQIGDIIERQLRKGDIVLLNRQPTLHPGSMLAHTVIPSPHKTFRFSLATTSTFNADFDLNAEFQTHFCQKQRA